MKAIILTETARRSLGAISCHTREQWGKAQREKYMRTLDHAIHTLAAHPQKGKACDHLHQGLRVWPTGSHAIYYVSGKRRIVIVDVLHAHMDPSQHLVFH